MHTTFVFLGLGRFTQDEYFSSFIHLPHESLKQSKFTYCCCSLRSFGMKSEWSELAPTPVRKPSLQVTSQVWNWRQTLALWELLWPSICLTEKLILCLGITRGPSLLIRDWSLIALSFGCCSGFLLLCPLLCPLLSPCLGHIPFRVVPSHAPDFCLQAETF